MVTNRISIKIGYAFFVAVYGILLLFLRPAIPGQLLGGVYFIFIFIYLATLIVFKPRFKLQHFSANLYGMLLLIALYLFIQAFIKSVPYTEVIFTLLLMFMGVSIASFYTKKSVYVFSKLLVLILVALSISYLISLILFSLKCPVFLGNISIPTRGNNHAVYPVYFPFSIYYNGPALVAGRLLPRAIGFIREPGLLQMLVIIGYWIVDFYKWRHSLVIKLLLVLLLIMTFSTAGFGIFALTLIVKRIYHLGKTSWLINVSFLCVILVGIIFLFTSSSQFGLENKFRNKSGLSRIEAVIYTYKTIKEYPIAGIGFHKRPNDMELGINFFGAIAQNGLLGSFLFILPFIFVFNQFKRSNYALINMYLALLITVLFSQPLYDKAMTLVFLSFLLSITRLEKRIIKESNN